MKNTGKWKVFKVMVSVLILLVLCLFVYLRDGLHSQIPCPFHPIQTFLSLSHQHPILKETLQEEFEKRFYDKAMCNSSFRVIYWTGQVASYIIIKWHSSEVSSLWFRATFSFLKVLYFFFFFPNHFLALLASSQHGFFPLILT